jgi:hypothetical protein
MTEIKPGNNTRTTIRQETVDHSSHDPRDTIKGQKPGGRARALILSVGAEGQKETHITQLKNIMDADGRIRLSLRIFMPFLTLTLFIYRPSSCKHDHPPSCHQDYGEANCPKMKNEKAHGLAIMKHREQKRSAEQEGWRMARTLGAHIHECGAGNAGHAVHELNLGTYPHNG